MNSSGKKGQFPFSPRSDMKRDRKTFHSTVDSLRGHQTTNASHRFSLIDKHNASISQPVMNNRQTEFRSGIAERISTSKSKQPLRGSVWAGTRDRVGSYIAYDDQYSKLEERVREQASFYHLSKNLVTFGGWPIPNQILEDFDRLSRGNTDTMTVSQGFLPECCHFYYSINEVIYFINLSQCSKIQQPAPLVRVQLSEKVTKVMECRLSSNLLSNSERDRVLVVSHYESLAFYLYHIEDGKIFLDDLHQSINMPGEIINQVVATESGNVFYVDRFGELSMIEDRPTKHLFLFNTGNRQMVASIQQPSCLKQFISKYGQEGISDGIKFIAKSIGQRWNRFMAKSITCKGLQIDHKRKMIFTLVQKEFSKFKYYNTVSAYKMNESGGMDLLQSLGQEQLFQKLEAFGLRFNRQFLKILKIKAVDQEFFPQSNLQIIIANGTRIYLSITKDYIKPDRTIYSPDTDSLQVVGNTTKQLFIASKDNKIRCDPTNQCQLVDVAVRRQQCLLIYSSSSRFQSYFCSRLNASSRSTVGEVMWSSYGMNGKAYPKDIACWSIPQTCSYSRQIQKLLEHKPGHTILPVTHVHELARQVYLPPDFYLTVNDQEAEFLCRLRPIDIVYMWLSKLPMEECQNRFEQAVSEWKRVEIVAMLYIFLADTSFEFYSTPELEREMEEQQQRRERPESLRAHQSNTPMVTNSQKIPVLIKQKASRLIDYIGAKQQLLKEKDNDQYHDDLSVFRMTDLKLQACTTKEQALCLYISRLLRPIWNRNAQELSMEQTHIISTKLNDLMRFIDQTPVDFRMSETKKKDGTRQPSLFEQMRNFIQRCIQLLKLLHKISINTQYDFKQLVAQQSAFFEIVLFGELRRYDVKIINTYQSEYSRLVDEKFLRIAKFYFKILPINDHRALSQMCEEFGSLPSYFLDYLKLFKNLNIDTLKVQVLERVDRPDTQRKRLISTGTITEQYEAMLDMIGESSNIDDKLRYTNMAIDTVKQLLENRKLSKSDRNSYESDLKDLIKKKQLLLVQKALMDTLMDNNEYVGRLQCILDHNQIVPENLKAAVMKASDNTLSLIWYLNFRPSHIDEFNVSGELDRLIDCYQSNWPRDLQKTLTYVLNHIFKGGNWQLLTQLINKLQKANMSVYYNQFEDFFDTLEPSRLNGIVFWVSELLLAQGFQLNEIYDIYYKNVLELSSLGGDKQSRSQLIELYYWTFALQQLVKFVNLQRLIVKFRELSQKIIDKEMTVDNFDGGARYNKLQKLLSVVRPN